MISNNKEINILIQENISLAIDEINSLYVILQEASDSDPGVFQTIEDTLMEIFSVFEGKLSVNKKILADGLTGVAMLGDATSMFLGPTPVGEAISKTTAVSYVFIGILYISASFDYGGDQKQNLFWTGTLLLFIGLLSSGAALLAPGVSKAMSLVRNKNTLQGSTSALREISSAIPFEKQVKKVFENVSSESSLIKVSVTDDLMTTNISLKIDGTDCPVTINSNGTATVDLSSANKQGYKLDSDRTLVDEAVTPVEHIESINNSSFDFKAELKTIQGKVETGVKKVIEDADVKAGEVSSAVQSVTKNSDPATVILTNTNVSETLPSIIDNYVSKTGGTYKLEGPFKKLFDSNPKFYNGDESETAEAFYLLGKSSKVKELTPEKLRQSVNQSSENAVNNANSTSNKRRTNSEDKLISGLEPMQLINSVVEGTPAVKAPPRSTTIAKKQAAKEAASTVSASIIRNSLRKTLQTTEGKLKIPIYKEIEYAMPGSTSATKAQIDTGWELVVVDCTWRGEMVAVVKRNKETAKKNVEKAKAAFDLEKKVVESGKVGIESGTNPRQINYQYESSRVDIKEPEGPGEVYSLSLNTKGLNDTKAGDLKAATKDLRKRITELNDAIKWNNLETNGFVVRFDGDSFTGETVEWLNTHLYQTDDAAIKAAQEELAINVGVVNRTSNTEAQKTLAADAADQVSQKTTGSGGGLKSLFTGYGKIKKDYPVRTRVIFAAAAAYTRFGAGASSDGTFSPLGGVSDDTITFATTPEGQEAVIVNFEVIKNVEEEYGPGNATGLTSPGDFNIPEDEY